MGSARALACWPVRLRLIARDPERFPPREGPPDGLHRLLFATPRSDAEGVPLIWGQIHSGVNWIEAIEGAQRRFVPLPDSLVVSILGPGRITVGKQALAEEAGRAEEEAYAGSKQP